MTHPRILILCGETGQLNYYKEVAERMQRYGFSVCFCCDRDDDGVAQRVSDVATSLNASFFIHKGDRGPVDNTAQNTNNFFSRILKRIHYLINKKSFALGVPKDTGIPDAALSEMVKYHTFRIEDAQRVIDESGATVIVTGEDGIASDYWLLHVAKQRGLIIATLPYGMADSSSLVYKGVEEKAEDGSLYNTDSAGGSYIKTNHPQWIRGTHFGNSIYLPPSFIIAMEYCGITFRDPWCFQGGNSDIILSEGQAMQARYLQEGVPEKKIVVTGSIYGDVVSDAFERDPAAQIAFANCTKISRNKVKILVCVPPSETTSWAQKSEFSSVANYISRLCDDLKRFNNVQLSFSLHPRIITDDVKKLEKNGIYNTPGFVVDLIPSYDVLLVNGSSTARWALAARKVCIDYDLFQFGLDEFPNIASYLATSSYSETLEEIKLLATEKSRFEQLISDSLEELIGFGPLDGNSFVRICRQLEQIERDKIDAK